jgi:tRNA modification GTPase
MDGSTIAAVATPEGAGAIGIIKVSGPNALAAVCSVFRRGQLQPGSTSGRPVTPGSLKTWRMYFGHIFDPESGQGIDEVILAVMRAPNSYTREDVAEIQAHAGPKVLEKIFSLLVSRGIRPAEPGEFTRRAFINGRMDLTQAEAVADLINASSNAAVDMAVSQMAGRLSDLMATLRKRLVSVLSRLEATIDFPDSAGDEIDFLQQAQSLSSSVLKPIQDLRDAYEGGRFLRHGIQAVIIGRPNVGKSSLMNRLVVRQRSIVTDVAGTTRDCVEASLVSRGVPIVVADTAGLREDPDSIERLGIEKTREYMDAADILLFVGDAGLPVEPEDLRLYEQVSEKRFLLVINKTDLPAKDKKFRLPESWQGARLVEVSALQGSGIDALKDEMADMAFSPKLLDRSGFVPNWRQKCLLDRVAEAVSCAVSGLGDRISPELVAIDLREAVSAVDEITGQSFRPEILEEIFSRYCVGK